MKKSPVPVGVRAAVLAIIGCCDFVLWVAWWPRNVTNYTVGLALLNQLAGPAIFKNQIAKVQAHLRGACGG